MSTHNRTPDNATPDNATPDNATPDNASPDNATPDNATPDNATPDNATPDNATPDNATPDNSTPSNSSPSNSSPSNSSPSNSSPNSSKDSSKSSPEVGRSSNSTNSPPQGSNKSLPSNGGSDGGSNNGAVVGSVLGVGSVILVLVIICVIWRKKKRKQRYYYGEPPIGKARNYYNNGQPANPNWQNGQSLHGPLHQSSNGMSPPSVNWNGMGPPSGSWGTQYPLMNSGEMSSHYSMGGNSLAPSQGLGLSLSGGSFTYEELASATGGFSNDKIIGQGGFGYVYKGILPNGKVVAVKCLKAGSGQGEREFQAEIEIISRVHHRHLVSLVGYCISGGQRMLVYEFVPNGTLEHHLHGKGVPTMDWPTRMRIALGAAKGLAYLHEDCNPRIIHRDIKAANVLIDDSFEAKVADFGLAKLTSDNNTHVSTRVMGTFGYLAPEYASSGKLTEKSDVFSFGVMLLELITGKRPVDPTNAMEDSLVDWARPLLNRVLEDGNFGELVDPFLEGNYNTQEMTRMAACAAASVRHSAKKRAKMIQIVRALEGNASLDDLKEGVMKPSNAYTSSGGSEYDTMQYNADMMKFRKAIMSTQEFDDSHEL